jgi:hypothetical protein
VYVPSSNPQFETRLPGIVAQLSASPGRAKHTNDAIVKAKVENLTRSSVAKLRCKSAADAD